ncbi:DoxX family protein [Oscillatoria sp. CS-180]|uniref:DoxX family protein n=1 Tax=Oscillatoria sp. CS-180 TaxID=3021720 RepID=UPI00232BCE52|nr:DoxX family protein [Oscillatoria sp. CS-180]MDB9526743.1 DoxX family protein [Oscillatoria sp. CS-180]
MLIQKYVPLVARTAIAIIFLHSGIGKISDFSGTQQQIANAGLPLAPLVTLSTIAFVFLGSISLILGYKARIGAGLLLAFLIPATLVFHNPIVDPSQLIQFLKNLAIIGGLLMVVAYGSGPVSLSRSTVAPAYYTELHEQEEVLR